MSVPICTDMNMVCLQVHVDAYAFVHIMYRASQL